MTDAPKLNHVFTHYTPSGHLLSYIPTTLFSWWTFFNNTNGAIVKLNNHTSKAAWNTNPQRRATYRELRGPNEWYQRKRMIHNSGESQNWVRSGVPWVQKIHWYLWEHKLISLRKQDIRTRRLNVIEAIELTMRQSSFTPRLISCTFLPQISFLTYLIYYINYGRRWNIF